MQLFLIEPEVVKVILLSNSPGFTNILLEEVASEEEVMGLYV